MPTFGGFEEGRKIMNSLEITSQFLAGLLISPSAPRIHAWSKGVERLPADKERLVLDTLRRLKMHADALAPVPVSFRNCTVPVWRVLLDRLDQLTPEQRDELLKQGAAKFAAEFRENPPIADQSALRPVTADGE